MESLKLVQLLYKHIAQNKYYLSTKPTYVKTPSAITAGHPTTLLAAREILESGGNAADAAIAAYLTSFVSEPCMASAGAGGFAMVSDANETTVIDFFCQTPLQKVAADQLHFYPITIDFGTTTEDFHIGRGAAATPGAIAGIYALHELRGTIPLTDIARAVATRAKEGVALDSFQAYDLGLLQAIFRESDKGKEIAYTGDNLKKEGELIKMPAYADFVETLAIEGPDLFYKGEIAQQLSADYAHSGGNISYEDLSRYEAVHRRPLAFGWQGYRVLTTPSPSMGGAIIAAFLSTCSSLLSTQAPTPLSHEHYRLLLRAYDQINAIKDCPTALSQYLADHYGLRVDLLPGAAKWSGTSHLNVTDSDGLSVALTTSIGEGNGYFIPGTDMQMNNMLGEAALLPDGFHSWKPNSRLRSMMTPTMVRDQSGAVRLVTGTGGAGRIPFAIAQTMLSHLVLGLSIEEATQLPRIHVSDGVTHVENGYDTGSTTNVQTWDPGSLYFGGVGSIAMGSGRLAATGDYRRTGVSWIEGRDSLQ